MASAIGAARGKGDLEGGGILIGNTKPLVKELQRNRGVGMKKADEAIKFLEMHRRGKAPPLNMEYYQKIKRVVNGVRFTL